MIFISLPTNCLIFSTLISFNGWLDENTQHHFWPLYKLPLFERRRILPSFINMIAQDNVPLHNEITSEVILLSSFLR